MKGAARSEGFLTRLAGLDVSREVGLAVRERRALRVGGLVGASRAALLAALDNELPFPRLIVAPGAEEAAAFHDDLVHFLSEREGLSDAPGAEEVLEFPAFDATLPDARARERGRLAARTGVLEALAAGSARYIVASLAAVLQPVPSPQILAAGTLLLRTGQALDMGEVGGRLAAAGFARVPMVEATGEWSQRGGIVDIHPRGLEFPLRVELFGDDVESLRVFDPISQRSVETLESVAVPLLSAADAVGLPAGADVTTVRRALKKARLITSLLSTDALIVHVEEQAAAAWLARFESARPEEELGTMYARFSLDALDRCALRLSAAPVQSGDGVNARILGASALARDLVTFREALSALLERNRDVRLLCATAGDVSRVRSMLSDAGVADDERLSVSEGCLSHGFQVPALGIALLSYDELFGRTRLPRPRGRATRRPVSAPQWTDFQIGNPVVHLAHGIGIYRGLSPREKDGVPTDHLTIEFQGETLVHVPVTKAALVHRYVGAGEAKPRLSKVGGRTWERRKKSVATSVDGVALELLRTQALRKARPGLAFPPDGPEQLEFEATFPFDLTPDQETALAAIKSDMENDVPMDRLLCGDVGFGKTELAVRAAFKSVLAGKQVALLVPTTVLAEQHGQVFRERFASYPINVEVLSRFRTAREQREILERAADGRVDVVIGTHRLVSGDVAFRDLGLLVVDEEQRFGVKAKHGLRQARAIVDVLTMTATPIPRTRHMALLGLRDISSLTTAPFGRRPIETRVIADDDAIVRGALVTELERGGQAYFIHNRVKTIEKVAGRLRHAVPEARVEVVHGQLPDSQIEDRMLRFVDHEVDVLVATTIVESGLDIPNANTIFIDRADWLGLADLHQLRGRVGRYDRRAYCYLLVPARRMPTDAERRVRVVEELSDLGAGFRIAMRDMEIRGAGNLLGQEQSGYIASVGYELYCRLLSDAVGRVKHDTKSLRTVCHVNLPAATAIPREYIDDDRQRIDTYRRFSAASDDQEVSALIGECADRFGPPPEEIRLLARVARVRLLGELLGVTRLTMIVHDGEERVLLRTADPIRVRQSLGRLGKRIRAVDGRHCHLLLPAQDLRGAAILDAVLEALRPVGGGGAGGGDGAGRVDSRGRAPAG